MLGAALASFVAERHAGMTMEQSPERTGPPPRRGPSVDLDPNGIVTGKGPDRQRRQFLNYSFYRLDPVFRRLPADDRRAAAAEFVELVRKWESSDDLILRTYSLVGLRAGVDFMLWRIAFDPLCFQSMEATIRRSFDSDYPQEFVDLVGRLRYTEASLYTQRDTPMFACAKVPIDAILAQLANMV